MAYLLPQYFSIIFLLAKFINIMVIVVVLSPRPLVCKRKKNFIIVAKKIKHK